MRRSARSKRRSSTITTGEAAAGPKAPIETIAVQGIAIAAIGLSQARDAVIEAAPASVGRYVTVTGAHGIVESAHDPVIASAHRDAWMSVPDGMPLAWLGRCLGKRAMERVYGPDLMTAIFADPRGRALRHYFYGGNPASIARLLATLESRHGAFALAGSHSPPMRSAGFSEDESVIEAIREARPDLVWVGLSTPKQELWMQAHMPRIGHGLGIGVGAAYDLVSGTTRQAPRWIQRSGLEWFFRLVVEPRRLWRRYVFIVPRFLVYSLVALRNGTAGGGRP